MGKEGSPATICWFYPGGQAASQSSRMGRGHRLRPAGEKGASWGSYAVVVGGAECRRGVGSPCAPVSTHCSRVGVQALVSKHWSRRLMVEGGSEGKNDRDRGGRQRPISPCFFREIRWRVVLGGTSPLGQAGVSSEVAPSSRCPRKAKLQEPQICLLCPSLRKDLRLWF